MKHRQGFTLIELMIVAAVSVILLAAVFSVNFRITSLWGSERVRQALQQNFRFAGDALTANLRQATDVLLPAQNTLGDVLEFDYIATPSPAETRYRVIYQRVGAGPYHVERRDVQLESYDEVDANGVSVTKWRVPEDAVWSPPTPVTEDISSLAALHFLHRGSRIVTILVAEYESGGSTRTISYTLQTSVRTLPLFVPHD
jgi:prepilin-type N-terminal cleavage/methylation domain-containing protein